MIFSLFRCIERRAIKAERGVSAPSRPIPCKRPSLPAFC
ncbi:protein of unknown function [Shinella sp. WSC3-e]|nr:protein of unknown function [Shinella sp. WSC3-e]